MPAVPAASDAAPAAEAAADVSPIVAARNAVVSRFKSRFFTQEGTPNGEFSSNFDEAYKSWDDVGAIVAKDSTESFGPPSGEQFQDGDTTTITGRIFGLYTEVTVTNDGKVTDCYFEID